jgi:multidrug efflux pump subunit AcrA (membrane-fusion protein)
MSDGLQAEVFFPDRPGKSYTAKLDSTSSAIDASSRTLLAQLLVDNANNELLPGSYAEVHFKLGVASAASMLRVPANALLFSGDGLRVATVAGDKVVMKKVTLGRDFGTEIEIASGLTTQDQVIVAPPDSITDSTQVRITQSEDTRQAQQAPQKDAKS